MSERRVDPESFLTEIDRRLRAIQDELRPGEAGSLGAAPGQAAIGHAHAPAEASAHVAPTSPEVALESEQDPPPEEVPVREESAAPVEAPAPEESAPSEPGPGRGRSGPLAAILGRNRPQAQQPERPEPDAAAQADRAAAPTPAPDVPTLSPTPIPTPDSVPADVIDRIWALTEIQAELLAASERLLEAFADLVRDVRPAGLFTPTGPHPARSGVSVSAGPFSDTEALRDFERAVSRLERVNQVTVRAYEGDDRAILDIELDPRPPSDQATP